MLLCVRNNSDALESIFIQPLRLGPPRESRLANWSLSLASSPDSGEVSDFSFPRLEPKHNISQQLSIFFKSCRKGALGPIRIKHFE